MALFCNPGARLLCSPRLSLQKRFKVPERPLSHPCASFELFTGGDRIRETTAVSASSTSTRSIHVDGV